MHRLPAARRLAARRSRCASTGCRTCAWSTPATSRCPPATSSGRCRALEAAVENGRAGAGAIPVDPRRRPHRHLPRRHRRRAAGLGPGLDDPLRRARRHRRHPVRLAVRATASRCAGSSSPARCAATGSCRSGCAATGREPETLDWMAEQRMRSLRDDRDRAPRPRRLPHRGVRHRHRRLRRRLPLRRHRRLRPGPRARHRHPGAGRPVARASCSTPCAGSASSCPSSGIDVVEVAPPYDHADITAALANRVVLEALSAHRPPASGRARRHALGPARRRCSPTAATTAPSHLA